MKRDPLQDRSTPEGQDAVATPTEHELTRRFTPRPNENAWLLGYAAASAGTLRTQHGVGVVGARGLSPILSKIHVRIAGQPDLTVVRISRPA